MSVVGSGISRRRLLAFGAGGAALLACGGGLSWLSLGYRVADGDVPVATTVKELAIVRAIVEALLPEDGDLPSGLALGVHQRIDEELWAMPPHLREDLKSALQLLEHLPPVFGFPGRLTRLSPADRERAFVAFLRAGPTPIVQAATALKQMCHLFYFARDEAWAGIGYDGPWIATPKPPPSALRYAEALAAARGAR